MAIYNGRLPKLNEDEIKRYSGLKHAEGFPEQYVKEAALEVQLVAEPRGVYQCYDYDPETHTILSDPPMVLDATGIIRHLGNAKKVYVLAVTVGETVEERSSALFKEGKSTLGLLVDAAATTAVEQVADQVNEIIEREAKKQGFKTTWRFSPGYGNWPVTVQQEFAKIIKTEEIGLTVTDTSMLFPRKSVTAIVGCQTVDEEGPKTQRGCTSCSQVGCDSRKVPERGKTSCI